MEQNEAIRGSDLAPLRDLGSNRTIIFHHEYPVDEVLETVLADVRM
jgi:hypothetical protein